MTRTPSATWHVIRGTAPRARVRVYITSGGVEVRNKGWSLTYVLPVGGRAPYSPSGGAAVSGAASTSVTKLKVYAGTGTVTAAGAAPWRRIPYKMIGSAVVAGGGKHGKVKIKGAAGRASTGGAATTLKVAA